MSRAIPTSAAGGQEATEEATDLRVSVLLPLPLTGAYDYGVPAGLELSLGDIVRVPLGSREVIGVVWEPDADSPSLAYNRLKPVIERFELPPFSEPHRRFIDWVASYTVTPPGAVLRLALRAQQALEPPKPMIAYRLAEAGAEGRGEAGKKLRLTPARARVLQIAEDGLARPASELARMAGVGPSVVKGLAQAGVLVSVSVPVVETRTAPNWQQPGPSLSSAQQKAADALRSKVGPAKTKDTETDAGGFSVNLLDGVTGAGKTEVYFEAIAAALGEGRQVLVLLPEIALTAQWLDRFVARFGTEPDQWHSDLTSKQRRRAWRAAALGDAKVVVGARSALFLPFQDLGLIVIDEEHETAFKQEDGVIYHARDMAVVRARCHDIPIVLVSATPSLETVVNVEWGRYSRLSLPERHGSAGLPEVSLVDLRQDRPPPVPELGQSWLSTALRQALGETFAAGEQAMLFLNRRGYAPLTLCRACGHRLACPNCTAWLVEHRLAARLQCHHCGYGAALPDRCSECGAEASFAACGPGVERLAEEVGTLFPELRAKIVSSDSINGPVAAAALVKAVQSHEIELLIGTQIIAKGHHFPELTCVGVVDADLGLMGGDLRAAERTYQILHQVAGRAGRAERPGRVLVQTHEPEHPVMQALIANDRESFFAIEAETRQRAQMPPFARLASLILSSPDPTGLDRVCRDLARLAPSRPGVEILGPAPAPLAVLRRRHRRRFLVKTRRDIAPQPVIRAWLGGLKLPNSVRVQIDIDPYSFL